jgi:Holliday junction resolvasome RuvABC endonuclease subunit
MRIVAYDLSLGKTGAAFADDPLVRTETIVYPGTDQGVKRLRWLRSVLVEKAMPADLVIIEGYAYRAHGRGVSLGELGGAVRVGLADVGIPFVVVPPKSRAKYATGRGDADKYEVLAAAIRRLGYQGDSHDEADALWLVPHGPRPL